MKPVATVNGVQVFSTKQISQINNSKIVFTDGSWCDVATKQVVNNGPGSISLGSPPAGEAEAKPKKVGPQNFNARVLEVNGISANVDITVGDQMSITIEGPEADVDAIKFAQQGDRLVVQSNGRRRKGGDISGISMSGSGGIFIGGRVSGSSVVVSGGGSTVVMSGNDEPSVVVNIEVPKGTEVIAHDVDGKTTIGDTEGPVNIAVNGQQKTKAGRVTSAVLNANGQSKITVEAVTNTLSMNCNGQSQVKVNSGEVNNLSATTNGQSGARFKGKAQNATLTSNGQSSIRVDHVVNRPVRSSHGQSEIEVDNW